MTRRPTEAIREAMQEASLALCPTQQDFWKLNDRLDESQWRLAREIGPRRVNALIRGFITEAGTNRAMWDALYTQDDPYRWLHDRRQHRARSDDAA